MDRITVTVAAGALVVLAGPEQGDGPSLVAAPGLVRLVDDASAIHVAGGEVSWDVGPGTYRVTVYDPPASPAAPSRAAHVETFEVVDEHAARRAALIAEITQLRALVDRIEAYISQREAELRELDAERGGRGEGAEGAEQDKKGGAQ